MKRLMLLNYHYSSVVRLYASYIYYEDYVFSGLHEARIIAANVVYLTSITSHGSVSIQGQLASEMRIQNI